MPLDVENPIKVKKPKQKKAKVRGKPKKSLDMMTLEEKLEAPSIKAAREAIKKKYGGHVVSGYDKPMPKIKVIPTGFKALDLECIGAGNPNKAGFPRGHPIEVFGKASGGKSTLAMAAIANAQKNNEHCVWVDLERTMDDEYARAIGIDTEKWDYCVPADGDEAADMILTWVKAGASMVVLDSVGVLDTKADIDKDFNEDGRMAGNVHLMKKILMKTAKPAYDNGTVLVLINQMRSNPKAKGYQKQTQTTGGYRLEHAFVLRIKVTRGEKIKAGDDIIGIDMKIFIEKNKIGPPFKSCTLPVIFGKGISMQNIVFTEAVQLGIIEKAGSFYSFSGQTLGQGKKKAQEALEADPELFALVERLVNGEEDEEEELEEDVEQESNEVPPETVNLE